MHEIWRKPVRPTVLLCRGQEKEGETQMHADKK
jgi:hypothetical protein